ncbi:MAG: tRNA preQ1(34) S-adenosylmethionine ribosyltransferase-isomerase QueA [Bacteroidia bacterium]|nr:tRNA preQ1(34) S-adenosylmethionine ribosyltransferase-isomerase QueA [Bacteroidia bacterium]
MKLSQFKYKFPAELVADRPLANRDDSRMMVVNRKTGTIEHKTFKDILDYFDEGDVFVLNNTRVFPSRLYGNKEKTGAKIQVVLLRELDAESKLWDVLVDPARKIRIGNKLYFGENDMLVAEVIDNTTSRGRTLRFLYDGPHDEFKALLYSLGAPHLPPYISREPDEEDFERYQTYFARVEGAVTAPASGLHFSRELLKRLEIKGINFAELTLHVGLGGFRAVEVEDLSKHKTDSEECIITAETAEIVNDAIDARKKILAVGPSVMRAIETSVTTKGHLKEFKGWTNKFIYPPYDFSIADAMLCNFYLPESTLLMQVAAFMGTDLCEKAYEEAIREKYRLFAYGDAMLII